MEQKPQSAQELELMHGFPPAQHKLVTHANQLFGPYNRWSFQNIQKLNPTSNVWRGNGPAIELAYEPRDLDQISYQRRDGTTYTFGDMLKLSYTDGIIVMHQGKLIYERYLNGMQAHTHHAWASGSKSMTGTIAALLAYEGLFDTNALVSSYLPELQGCGFGDATIRQVMDMTTAITFDENDTDPVNESRNYGILMGWQARPENYRGPTTSYDFLATLQKHGQHGTRFAYLTPNTDVLAWLMKRLLNKTLAEIMHEHIWSKLGVERDAYWVVGPTTEETSGSGLLTTLRDMARFGQMLLQKGRFNGQQIIPVAVVEDIERGGDQDAYARSLAAGPNKGASYHHQWWTTYNEHNTYLALGYGGQMLYIDPIAQLVIAKFSSYPTPVEGGLEFFHAFVAFAALSKELTQ